jgi:amidase
VPTGTDLNEVSNFLVCEHVVTRTVRDTAAILDVTGAPRAVGATRAPTPRGPFAAEVGVDPGRLRIGFLDTVPTGASALHPEAIAAVMEAARLLESLGHTVEPSFPAPWADPEAMLRFSSVWATECAWVVDDWAAKVGRPIGEDDLEPLTWALTTMGRGVSGPKFMATAVAALEEAAVAARWWRPDPHDDTAGGHDLLLTPTVAEPPPPHGTFAAGREAPLAGFIRAGTFIPFTTQSNISGQPAISVPLHWTADDVPVGVQLVAAFGREDLLIRVAAQLEAAAPWADRRPPVHA